MNIDKYISESNLSHYDNNLQCICLLITGRELSNGYYAHFIDQLSSSSTDSLIIASQIDFKFILTCDVELDYGFISKHFKSVELIKLYIPKYLDVYYHSEEECINNIPALGLKSGPNYIFFQAIKELINYNTTLFLECDIFLSDNWLHDIFNYVEHSNGFWISGAMYDGQNCVSIHDVLNTHINGGVALYATGNHNFQKFMKFCYDNLPFYVKERFTNLPYDFLIKMIIDDNYNSRDMHDVIWGYINRNYVYNNYIFNYSTQHDVTINNDMINKLYNHSIIHKKPFIQHDKAQYTKFSNNKILYNRLSKMV